MSTCTNGTLFWQTIAEDLNLHLLPPLVEMIWQYSNPFALVSARSKGIEQGVANLPVGLVSFVPTVSGFYYLEDDIPHVTSPSSLALRTVRLRTTWNFENPVQLQLKHPEERPLGLIPQHVNFNSASEDSFVLVTLFCVCNSFPDDKVMDRPTHPLADHSPARHGQDGRHCTFGCYLFRRSRRQEQKTRLVRQFLFTDPDVSRCGMRNEISCGYDHWFHYPKYSSIVVCGSPLLAPYLLLQYQGDQIRSEFFALMPAEISSSFYWFAHPFEEVRVDGSSATRLAIPVHNSCNYYGRGRRRNRTTTFLDFESLLPLSLASKEGLCNQSTNQMPNWIRYEYDHWRKTQRFFDTWQNSFFLMLQTDRWTNKRKKPESRLGIYSSKAEAKRRSRQRSFRYSVWYSERVDSGSSGLQKFALPKSKVLGPMSNLVLGGSGSFALYNEDWQPKRPWRPTKIKAIFLLQINLQEKKRTRKQVAIRGLALRVLFYFF